MITNNKKKEQNTVIMTALKGNQDVSGNALKANGVGVIMTFAAKESPGAEMYSDRCSYILMMPDDEGDVKWMNENVFKYVDVLGTSSQGEIDRRVERLHELYVGAGGPERHAAGWGMVKSTMEHFGMIGTCASVFRRDI